ncbi:hypothetical protein V6N11_081280 [Hibiscus sabdariffa]|uniref:GH16 domain-containing protein n=1 Tax=Hibiscus sabdariffa TaxID=183260 RepID=A0ABR2QJI0_9ROSI
MWENGVEMGMKLPYLGSSLFLVLALVSVVASGSEKGLPIISFDEGYNQLFGDDNLAIHRDGKTVHLTLNERTILFSRSGFVSQDLYLHGYFSASIKLSVDYTAGVVVAFYIVGQDFVYEEDDEQWRIYMYCLEHHRAQPQPSSDTNQALRARTALIKIEHRMNRSLRLLVKDYGHVNI